MKEEMYTDGSCLGNPGAGGWAVVFPRTGKILSGCEDNTTNNRMEMMAIIYALEESNEDSIIYTDSTYCKKGLTEWVHGWLTRGWKKADGKDVMNRDLWEKLWSLYTLRKPDIQWVKGHSKNEWNAKADKHARKAANLVAHDKPDTEAKTKVKDCATQTDTSW